MTKEPASPRVRPRRRRVASVVCSLLVLVLGVACSKYFGEGPDPAQDGRVQSCKPLSAIDGECPGLVQCLQGHCSQELNACYSDPNGTTLEAQSCDDLARCMRGEQNHCSGCLSALSNCERTQCNSWCPTSTTSGNGGAGGRASASGGNGGGGSGGKTGVVSGGGSGAGGSPARGGTGGVSGRAGTVAAAGHAGFGLAGGGAQGVGGARGGSPGLGGKGGAAAVGGATEVTGGSAGAAGGSGVNIPCDSSSSCLACAPAATALSTGSPGVVCCGSSHTLISSLYQCACEGACASDCDACSMPIPPGSNTCVMCLATASPNGCLNEYSACQADQ